MRLSTAALMVGMGAPRSRAFWQAHLPVPFCWASSRIISTSGLPGLGIGFGEDIGGDLDQVGFQFALVPVGENVVKFFGRKAQAAMKDIVDLGDQLHVAVFDAVVHHLDVMTGAARSHVGHAGLAVLGFGGDGLQDRRDGLPGSGTDRPA